MRPTDFSERKPGRLLKHQRGYWAFLPDPLPPKLELTWDLAAEISAADRSLSELAGIGRTLPNPHLRVVPRPYAHGRSCPGRFVCDASGAQQNLHKLVHAGILEEMPGRSYGRIFIAREVLSALEQNQENAG